MPIRAGSVVLGTGHIDHPQLPHGNTVRMLGDCKLVIQISRLIIEDKTTPFAIIAFFRKQLNHLDYFTKACGTYRKTRQLHRQINCGP